MPITAWAVTICINWLFAANKVTAVFETLGVCIYYASFKFLSVAFANNY